MKKAFSLLELIFAIVVIGIIASYAVPKYLNTKDNALATTIKRDVVTIITSVQSYYLINGTINNISDVITLSKLNWEVSDNKITFAPNDIECIVMELDNNELTLDIDSDSSNVCTILEEMGVENETFNLM
ncbi:prepilin-type cleavage/methylation domain-containing protein [Halarcobacter mediterraneus]|uniref:Prepilin-type cleavage/methylation domain-containing protein n=1 Tax=Halarcobacter mediterraneus TaxID=2023153 RepID=A0A4Q1AUQ6_9BACT|nr:prepilin-type N-terminal cleavage/methylation domain-containing protein [Halarcobacter mediterraneus]RXK13874.1 prepilin-type cleavage/methylation domain-containing protein [Halarcobacter mediterraneus]